MNPHFVNMMVLNFFLQFQQQVKAFLKKIAGKFNFNFNDIYYEENNQRKGLGLECEHIKVCFVKNHQLRRRNFFNSNKPKDCAKYYTHLKQMFWLTRGWKQIR